MEDKRSVNLCSKYILPLLSLNQYSFGTTDRFVNSYITEDDEYIVVECLHPFSSITTNHTNYKLGFQRDGNYFAVFGIPDFYRDDIRRFREGKYSKFTESAKTIIRKKSGMTWRAPIAGGGYKSAPELLALDKDKELKKHLEEKLAVKIDNDAELVSIPGEDNFFDLKLSNKLETII